MLSLEPWPCTLEEQTRRVCLPHSVLLTFLQIQVFLPAEVTEDLLSQSTRAAFFQFN